MQWLGMAPCISLLKSKGDSPCTAPSFTFQPPSGNEALCYDSHGFSIASCSKYIPEGGSILLHGPKLTEPLSGAEMIISLGFLSLASIALGAAAGTWLEAEYLPLGTWLGELGGLVGWGHPESLWLFLMTSKLEIMFLNVFDVSLDGSNG